MSRFVPVRPWGGLGIVVALVFCSWHSTPAADPVAKTPSLTPAKMLAEDERRFVDDADAALDVAVSDLVIPTGWLTRYPRESESQKFQQELRALLTSGFDERGKTWEDARRHCDAARGAVADDPRAHYAYGLVLLAHHREIPALEEFQDAIKAHKLLYLPAWQGVAWVHLARGNFSQGLAAQLDLARRLDQSKGAWPVAEDQERVAEWLGGLTGFAEGPGKTKEHAAAIDKAVADLGKTLHGTLKTRWDAGRQQVAARWAELRPQAEQDSVDSLAVLPEVRAARLAADQEVARLEQELQQVRQPHLQQLADWNQEIRTRSEQIHLATAKLPGAAAEVEQHANPKKHAQMKGLGNRRTGKAIARNENAGEKKIRETELASAQKKEAQLKQTIDESRQAIDRLRQQRDTAQADYRSRTAAARYELSQARFRAAELAGWQHELEQGTIKGNPHAVRAKSLRTYVPFVPELERDRLLVTLRPSRS